MASETHRELPAPRGTLIEAALIGTRNWSYGDLLFA